MDWRETIPTEHITWLRGLPRRSMYDATRRLVFVHAGIEPATVSRRSDAAPICGRARNGSSSNGNWPDRDELKGLTVVHGHTPRSFEPEIYPHRINVDTGACFGGPLTAVMLKDGEAPEFLRSDLETAVQRIDDARAAVVFEQVRALPVHDVAA